MASQRFPNSIPIKSQIGGLTAAESEKPGAEQIAESDHGFQILDFWQWQSRRHREQKCDPDF